ncbi:MAG: hypothetical protein AMXMBFR84_21470 [Candidatus Hydrogenedentota bacterium]
MYRATADFRGDPAKALDKARDFLAAQNFEVSPIGGGQVIARNTSIGYTSKRPFSGATQITISISSSTITLDADLSRVKWFGAMTAAGIVLLDIVMISILYATAGKTAVYAVLFATAPWVFLIPIMFSLFRKQTTKALDTLMQNLKSMG